MKKTPIDLLDNCDTLFLDRDGVINVLLPGDYVKCWEEFRFVDGFLDWIGGVSSHFKHIIIVTNQRGVGKDLMSMNSLEEIHSRMISEIEKSGGRIDAIYVCTALDDSDHMRKPNTGMIELAMKDFPDISMQRSIMIGDQESDRKFADNCGMRFLKV